MSKDEDEEKHVQEEDEIKRPKMKQSIMPHVRNVEDLTGIVND